MDRVELYKPTEDAIELPVKADCIAVESLLRILNIPFTSQERHNAAFMSVSGELPILKSKHTAVEGLYNIRSFLKSKGHCLSADLSESQRSELEAYMALMHNTIRTAEMYMIWSHQGNSQAVKKSLGKSYPIPLNFVIPWLKGRSVMEQLKARGWAEMTQQEVCDNVGRVCHGLSAKLGPQQFFFGANVTEVDVLVCGHVQALLRDDCLPDVFLRPVIQQYKGLIDLSHRIETLP